MHPLPTSLGPFTPKAKYFTIKKLVHWLRTSAVPEMVPETATLGNGEEKKNSVPRHELHGSLRSLPPEISGKDWVFFFFLKRAASTESILEKGFWSVNIHDWHGGTAPCGNGLYLKTNVWERGGRSYHDLHCHLVAKDHPYRWKIQTWIDIKCEDWKKIPMHPFLPPPPHREWCTAQCWGYIEQRFFKCVT